MRFTVIKYSDFFYIYAQVQVHFKCMLRWLLLVTYANLATV